MILWRLSMNKYIVDRPLTDDLIKKINYYAKNEKITIIFKSTKGLKKENVQKLSSNVTISITGGLDPKKNKFNNEHYQRRTYYSPSELANIISIFEKIERNINPLWNDLEKCIYIYKSICEYSNYSENVYNGRDAARNLLGMITGKSVCSGYALIFKEAMDRVGIKCYYQNREGHHSWNAVEINGKLYAIELTWDTYNKVNNNCCFFYFGKQDKKEFYANKHHDISYESEEKEFEFEKISEKVFQDALDKISMQKIYETKTMVNNGLESVKVAGKNIIIKNNIPYLVEGSSLNTFVRNDNSSFLIIPTNRSGKGVNEFIFLIYVSNEKLVRATKIYSEMNLLTSDNDLRTSIANNLLSLERVKDKINNYNGYVGYVLKNDHNKYYTQQFEESLNIYR